jgi:CRP/FNR family transcriptional activator FtrB
VAEGGVSLISEAPGENSIIDFLGKGDVILVPPVLLALPYMVTAKAVADLVVVVIPAAEFRALAKTQLPLATALNELLATQWRLLVKHLTGTRSRDADSRVIQFIVDAAGATKGPARFVLPGSKRDLAAHLGVTPETLSRSLKRLGALGVKTAGSRIEIENMARLGNRPSPRRAATR